MSVGQDDVLGLAELVEGNDHHAEAGSAAYSRRKRLHHQGERLTLSN